MRSEARDCHRPKKCLFQSQFFTNFRTLIIFISFYKILFTKVQSLLKQTKETEIKNYVLIALI